MNKKQEKIHRIAEALHDLPEAVIEKMSGITESLGHYDPSGLERLGKYLAKPSNRFKNEKGFTLYREGTAHSFTHVEGEIYKCRKCGLDGVRKESSWIDSPGELLVLAPEKHCVSNVKHVALQPKGKVMITIAGGRGPGPQWGFEVGMALDISPCPVDYWDKYADHVWVKSPKTGEIVRLLPSEYVLISEEDGSLFTSAE